MTNVNHLELNQGDNFIFAIDISLSMGATDCPGGMKRIDFLKEGVATFIDEAGKYDSDGIDLITFGVHVKAIEGVTPEKAKAVLAGVAASEGATNTAGALAKGYELHKAYKARGGTEQTVLFLATDGAPSDPSAVVAELRGIAKQLEAGNEDFSVSFLTVGQIDAHLRAFLAMLDDDLNARDKNNNPIDFVDVKQLDQVDFMSAFVGAVHD